MALADVGTAAATDAAIGAGIGGLTSAVTGGNILQGALGGGLGGAVTGGLGAEIGGFGGGIVGDVAGGALSGALGGVVDSAVTGGNIGTGALLGGAMGGVMGGVNSTPTTGTGGGTSAISTGGPNASAPGALSTDVNTTVDYTGSPGQPAVSVSDAQSAQGVGWGSSTAPVTSTPLSNVGTPAGNANPAQVLGSITSPEAGGTGNFVNNPIYGTGASSTGGFSAPSGTGVGQSSLADASNWLTNNQTPGSGLGSSGPGATGSTPGGAAGGANSGGSPFKSFLNNPSWSGAGDVLASNPGAVVGALGLGASALTSQRQPKGYNQLSGEANQLASQGAQLQQSLNGALPAGAQSALNQASNSAKAQIRSTYAASGLSGSTMEAQALANVDQTVAAQGFQMADQLYQQGVQESGMASNLYQQIMQVNAQSDAALSSAIGNFASALAGGGGSGLTQAERKALLGG
jgi:hypothetical protein